MKIAVVTETFHPFISGTAKRYFEVFRRIAKQGHNVHVFTARMADSWPIFDEVEGIYIHRTKKVYSNFITQDSFRSTSDVLDFSLWSSRQILQDAFDVVEATHCPLFPLITSYLCKKLKGFPLVATFHEVWYNQWYLYAPRKIYAPFGIALEGITAKIPDMAVAVSNMTAERLISCFGYPKDKVIVIPNGVDLDFCKSISVTRNKNTIIYAGRLNTHKKIEWLLEAYFIIKKKRPQLELRIVGDGSALSRYVKFAKDHDLIDVYFTGQVDYTTFLKEIKSAGIFVLTSI
ncbi:MAG: glycosyltransferase family 4 protein, partial [Candidatus Bathyarchaeia archaeon]